MGKVFSFINLVQRILHHFFDFPAGRETLQRMVSLPPEEIIQFQEARAFYEANQDRLLAEYEGKFIAILNGKVIDSDRDFSRLAERIYQKEGYREIFMPRVEKKAEVVHL